MKQSKRFTNLEQFHSKIRLPLNMEENDFEVIISELDQEDQTEEDNVKYLHQEDAVIQSLHICMRKSTMNMIPRKEEFELSDKLGEDLVSEKDKKIQFSTPQPIEHEVCKSTPKALIFRLTSISWDQNVTKRTNQNVIRRHK